MQLKINISETTPTGKAILETLLSDDPNILKRYGLGPKVTRANKLLWLAYLGVTQGHAPGGDAVTVYSPTPAEFVPPQPKKAESQGEAVTVYSPTPTPSEFVPPLPKKAESRGESVTVSSPTPTPNDVVLPNLEEAGSLSQLELKVTKADDSEMEDDALDEGALMAGLID
jgi:hypothetical protein